MRTAQTAKERGQFVETWRDHINQLQHLALQADIPYADWLELRQLLHDWVLVAADKVDDWKCDREAAA